MFIKNYQVEQKINYINISIVDDDYLGVIHCNSQGEYWYLNQKAESFLGKQGDSLLGKKIWDDFLDIGNRLKFQCKKAFAKKKSIQFEIFSQQLNKWLKITIYPQEGNRLSVYIVDINKQKKIEHELIEKQKQLTTKYNSISIPSYIWKKEEEDFVLINYNPADEIINNYDIKPILGSKLSIFYKNFPDIIEDVKYCFTSQENFSKEVFYPFVNNSKYKYFKVNYIYASPDLVMIYKEEITELKIKEEKDNILQELIKTINESEDFNSAMSMLVCNMCLLTDWDFAEFWLPNHQKNIIKLYNNCANCLNLKNGDQNTVENEIFFEKGEGFLGKIWEFKQTKFYTNIDDELIIEESCYFLERAKNLEVKTTLGIPLIYNNQVIAIITLYSYQILENEYQQTNIINSLINQLKNVIQRKKAEDERNLMEKRYNLLINNSSEGVILLDEKNRIVFINPKITDIIGYSYAEIFGKCIFDFLYQPIKDITIYDVEKGVSNQKLDLDKDFEFRHKNGSKIWVMLFTHPMFKNSGEYEGLLVMMTDISERKKAELSVIKLNQNLNRLIKERTFQLERKEDFFRAIFEQAAIGICLYEISGQLLQANRYFCDLLGYSNSEIKGKSLLEFIIPSSRKQTLKYVNKLLITDKISLSFECRFLLKNETFNWVKITISLIKNEQKQPLYLLAMVENIEQHKQIEKQLKVSEKKYQTLFELLPVGVSVTDSEGNILEVNNCSENLLGISIQEHLKRNLYDSHWNIINSNKTLLSPSEYPAIQAIKTQKVVKNVEIGVTKPNGDVTWLSVNASPIPWENYGAVTIFNDITERKKIEQMKDEFVSITSHELRTPLTSIKASLGLLSTGKLGTFTEKGKKLLDFASSDIRRLERLINDILEHQRLRFDSQVLQYGEINIDTIIEQSVNVIQPLADKKQIDLSVLADSVNISADGDRLIQLLTNLLSNAIKVSENNTKIRLKCTVKEDHTLWEIEDQGVGIPPDKLEIIFEPFCQINSSDSRKYQGTGLGLAICRSIVNSHGGKIWVESELGVGSKFSFTIPLSLNH